MWLHSACGSAYQRSGHLALRKVLASPYADFIASPYSYGFRGMCMLGMAVKEYPERKFIYCWGADIQMMRFMLIET